ncbi:hypothetical protein DFH08DRAFT_894305 [Mycena albidolilacea]|uniref:Uncharacterized protein n=1 Tax=Mycena albidolilacea TaxID=1033008 RepID=A0AAD6ZBP3_9AGAR|nr:hypothetical protein DFH08DRAFT_894305 [Mycena albidolilacea]
MFRATTRKVLALNLRRLHHDIPRAGIVFPVDHIDVAPAADRSSTSPAPAAHHTPAPARPQLRPSSTPPIHLVSVRVEKKSGPRVAALVALVGIFLLEIWAGRTQIKAENERLAEAVRFIAKAPDLGVLRENSDSDIDALAAHLSGLLHILLSPRVNAEFEQALTRLRTQEDAGRAAITEACVQIHEIVQDRELGVVERKRRMGATLSKLLRASGVEQPGGSATVGRPETNIGGSVTVGRPGEDTAIPDWTEVPDSLDANIAEWKSSKSG